MRAVVFLLALVAASPAFADLAAGSGGGDEPLMAGAIGTLSVANGGTGVATASAARIALGHGWQVADYPASPHADDDEFDSALSGAWTRAGTLLADAPDPFAKFTTASSFRESVNTLRPGWLLIQSAAHASLNGYHRAHTFATNDGVFLRLGAQSHRRTATIDDGKAAIQIGATSAGAIDQNNYILASSAGYGAAGRVEFYKVQAGVLTALSPTYDPTDTGLVGGNQVAYVFLQKVGSAWHLWVATESLRWVWVGSLTWGGVATLDRVMLGGTNLVTTDPGNIIVGFDFVRFRADLP